MLTANAPLGSASLQPGEWGSEQVKSVTTIIYKIVLLYYSVRQKESLPLKRGHGTIAVANQIK